MFHKPIVSYTIEDLLRSSDPAFIHRAERMTELSKPTLVSVGRNTLTFSSKSSHYKTNKKVYTVKVKFEDFIDLLKDKAITVDDAIDYVIEYGDIHVRSSDLSEIYYGFRYIGTQLGTLYGIPRENRYPKKRNPNLRGSLSKHEENVLKYIYDNRNNIKKRFKNLYNKMVGNKGVVKPKQTEDITKTEIGIGDQEGDRWF